jgi:hypothetical protein
MKKIILLQQILIITSIIILSQLFVLSVQAQQVPPSNFRDISEYECLTGDRDRVIGIKTALGCLAISDTNTLAGSLLRWGIGVGGGIAILMIIYAGFTIITSTGDPGRLRGGKELLGAAIGGLILLIFSVFILRLIGVNILGIL